MMPNRPQDAHIISWNLNSVDPQIILNLKTAKGMWKYLKWAYIVKTNFPHNFNWNMKWVKTLKETRLIKKYHSGFMNLWNEIYGIDSCHGS